MALNKLRQEQVVGDSTYEFADLDAQLLDVEGRTRVPAQLIYNTYLQWSTGEVNTDTDYTDYIDYTTQLDKITIASGKTSATFESYVIDDGGLNNVKFTTLDVVEVAGSENGSTTYYTRTGNTEVACKAATYVAVSGDTKKIMSPNARFIQFKIVMTKATNAPVVTSVAVKVMGAAATQEVYDARGGYKNLNDRLQFMSSMARSEYAATSGQTDFALPSGFTATEAGLNVLVYLNGSLQVYGISNAYIFDGTNVKFNTELFGAPGADKVTIIATNRNAVLSNTITPASDITLNTSSFDNNLNSTVTNVQLLAEKVDQLTGGGAGVTSVDMSTAISVESSIRLSVDTLASTNNSNAMSTEISTRTSTDNELSTSLSSEIINRSTVVSTETNLRDSADIILSTNISSEIINRSTAVSTEASLRNSADTAASIVCSTSLSTEISLRTSADSSALTANSIALSTEISLRISADAVNNSGSSTDLSTEISNRTSADIVLSTNISTEISTRTAQSTTTSTGLSTEVSLRTSADATITLQKVYDNSSNGVITLATGKVFEILDNNDATYFKCDPDGTNPVNISMIGPVTVAGDMAVTGALTISGFTTQIDSIITDYDHILLSPSTASAIALQIKPHTGVTLTSPIIDLYITQAGSSVFKISETGNTTVNGNFTIVGTHTVDVGTNKIINVVNGSNPQDAVAYNQLSTEISTRSAMKKTITGNGIFAGSGSTTLLTISGPTDTTYDLFITPTAIPTNPGSIGEIYAVKSTATSIVVTNTGSWAGASAAFDYTVFY